MPSCATRAPRNSRRKNVLTIYLNALCVSTLSAKDCLFGGGYRSKCLYTGRYVVYCSSLLARFLKPLKILFPEILVGWSMHASCIVDVNIVERR